MGEHLVLLSETGAAEDFEQRTSMICFAVVLRTGSKEARAEAGTAAGSGSS